MSQTASVKESKSMSYTVEQLVSVNPYNPDILPDLENYVNEQVSSESYSLDANLCLLRLYQFEPERMSTQIVARILIKVLPYDGLMQELDVLNVRELEDFLINECMYVDVYERSISSTISGVVHGLNATVFAYGSTGSLNTVFDFIKNDKSSDEFEVTCSYLEVYNEVIYDLLEKSSGHLELREDPEQGIIVVGLRCIKVIGVVFPGRLLYTCRI